MGVLPKMTFASSIMHTQHASCDLLPWSALGEGVWEVKPIEGELPVFEQTTPPASGSNEQIRADVYSGYTGA